MKRASLWQRKLSAMVGMVLTISICVVSTAAFAEDTAGAPYIAPGRIDSALIKDVTVHEKTPDDILADEERFAVTPATVISMGNESISFSRMPVPCKARVYFEKRKNQDSEAVKIVILDFNTDAGTQWTVSVE